MPTTAYPFFRRRHFLVRPSFQLKTVLLVLIFLLGFTLFVGAVLFYPLIRELESTGSSAVADEFLKFHERLWPPLLAAELLAALLFVFVTHRIAGPVYRVRVALERFLAGDYGYRIEFRKGDEFKELEPLINALGEHLVELKHQRTPAGATVGAEPVASQGKPTERRKGFSLMELMIVVAVLVLLTAIAVPSYFKSVQAAREAAVIGALREIYTAQTHYFLLNGRFAGNFDELNSQKLSSLELTGVNSEYRDYEFEVDAESDSPEWEVAADPKKTDPNARHFYLDQSGVIRYEVGTWADETSPPLNTTAPATRVRAKTPKLKKRSKR